VPALAGEFRVQDGCRTPDQVGKWIPMFSKLGHHIAHADYSEIACVQVGDKDQGQNLA